MRSWPGLKAMLNRNVIWEPSYLGKLRSGGDPYSEVEMGLVPNAKATAPAPAHKLPASAEPIPNGISHQ